MKGVKISSGLLTAVTLALVYLVSGTPLLGGDSKALHPELPPKVSVYVAYSNYNRLMPGFYGFLNPNASTKYLNWKAHHGFDSASPHNHGSRTDEATIDPSANRIIGTISQDYSYDGPGDTWSWKVEERLTSESLNNFEVPREYFKYSMKIDGVTTSQGTTKTTVDAYTEESSRTFTKNTPYIYTNYGKWIIEGVASGSSTVGYTPGTGSVYTFSATKQPEGDWKSTWTDTSGTLTTSGTGSYYSKAGWQEGGPMHSFSRYFIRIDGGNAISNTEARTDALTTTTLSQPYGWAQFVTAALAKEYPPYETVKIGGTWADANYTDRNGYNWSLGLQRFDSPSGGVGGIGFRYLSSPYQIQMGRGKFWLVADKEGGGLVFWRIKFLSEGGSVTSVMRSGVWKPSTTKSQEVEIDPKSPEVAALGNGGYTLEVQSLPIELNSSVAVNSPQYFTKTTPDNLDTHRPTERDLGDLGSWVKKLEALVIFYDSVYDASEEKVIDFRINLACGLASSVGQIWRKVSGPESGILTLDQTPNARYSNPKLGGLYRFDLDLLNGTQTVGTQALLPLAGADCMFWIYHEVVAMREWARSTRARAEIDCYSKVPGLTSYNLLKVWINISTRFDYVSEPVNSDETAPTLAFVPELGSGGGSGAFYSYTTVNGVVLHGSKINTLLWSVFGRYWGYSTSHIMLGADLQEGLRKWRPEQDSSKAAAPFCATFMDIRENQGVSTLLQQMQESNWKLLVDSVDLIEEKLWPCQDRYDEDKSNFRKPFLITTP